MKIREGCADMIDNSNVELNECPIKSYKIPKLEYTKQRKSSGVAVISLEKIMISYWNYLKDLEKFSSSHSGDYSVKMAINFLRIKKHKSYLKKCYSEYKLNRGDTKKVKEIAIKFSGSAGASSSGTFANFFQAIMRIKLPLMTIDEFLKKDKNLFKKLLEGDSNVSKEIRDKVIGAQNEFFKFADKSKISKNPDKEFFEHFKNLYKLSLDMPMVVDKSIGNLSEDLNCICRGKFKLSLKSKIQSKVNKSLESHGKRGKETFVRIFLSKIEDFEDRVEKVFRDNKIGREYLNLEQQKNFNLDKPQIFYKKLTTFDECLNFSNIKNKKKEDRMEKYFSDVYEYIDEILKLKGASVSEKIEVKNPIINIQKDYNKFVDEIQKKALLGPKYLSEWNKKNK